METHMQDSDQYILAKSEEILKASAGLTLKQASETERKIARYAAEKLTECDEREANHYAYTEAKSCFL